MSENETIECPVRAYSGVKINNCLNSKCGHYWGDMEDICNYVKLMRLINIKDAEIQALKADNQRYKQALENIAKYTTSHNVDCTYSLFNKIVTIAKQALEK